MNPMHADGAAHPTTLKLAHEDKAPGPAIPPTVTYQRGQFTFNRRFFETKFPGFFGVVLPGVVAENARRVEERLSSGLAGASGDVPRFTSYSRSVNFPADVATAHQMESAAKLFSSEDRAEKAAA